MDAIVRKLSASPAAALGGAVLWGLIELVALNRRGRAARGADPSGSAERMAV
jgi:hypothetical protein